MAIPEFSRIIDLSESLSFTKTVEFEATPEECQQLGQRFRVTLHSFKVQVSLSPVSGTKTTRLTGALTACIMQHCGITLLTTERNITSDIEVLLCPEEDKSSLKNHHKDHLPPPSIESMPHDDSDYEFYQDSKVDIGEIIAQYLCMVIDPYFKKPDALLEETYQNLPTAVPEKVNPFSVLQHLSAQPTKTPVLPYHQGAGRKEQS